MESELLYLPNPRLDLENLPYIERKISVYVNLYEIKIDRQLKLCQYPYLVKPKIAAGDFRIRDKIFKALNRRLKEVYGECFISGDSLYGLKRVDSNQEFKAKIYLRRCTEYTINFQKCLNEKIIEQENIQKDQLTKQYIEIIIRDILHANPKLDFYKGLFVRNDQKKKIETEAVSINYFPCFTTSFMEIEGGNFLNVTLKNKIFQTENIFDFLKKNAYTVKEKQKEIKDLLIGRSFKVSYANRNFIIDDILFDRNPFDQKINHDGKKKNLIDYFEDTHKIKILDDNQPLLLVKRRGPQQQVNNLYFLPELCYFTGIKEDVTKDVILMRELSKYMKYNPCDHIQKTNQILQLLNDSTRDPRHPNTLSAKVNIGVIWNRN